MRRCALAPFLLLAGCFNPTYIGEEQEIAVLHECRVECQRCPPADQVNENGNDPQGTEARFCVENLGDGPALVPAVDPTTLFMCVEPIGDNDDEDQDAAVDACDTLAALFEETPEREFQSCRRIAGDDFVQATGEVVCSTQSLYEDGRVNTRDAIEVTFDESSTGTFTFGASVSSPVAGYARIFLDGCETNDDACAISLAELQAQTTEFALDTPIGHVAVSDIALTLAQPAPGERLSSGTLLFNDVVAFKGSATAFGERWFDNLEVGAGSVRSAQLDLEQREFRATVVITGALGDETVLSLRGTFPNIPPRASIMVEADGCPTVLRADVIDLDGPTDLRSLRFVDRSTGVTAAVGPELTITAPGEHSIALVAMDAGGAHARSDRTISVVNIDPIAVIEAASQTECTGFDGAPVALSAASSRDPDGLELVAYEWHVDGAPAGSGVSIRPVLALGVHSIELRVEDACGGETTTFQTVEVVDTTPPVVDQFTYSGPMCLWPPNHRYSVIGVDQHFGSVIRDICDPAPFLRMVSATSSQEDNSVGDGDTIEDVVVHSDRMCIRSERQGGDRAPRVYTVQVEAVDASCNGSDPEVQISVGHDQRPAGRCIEDAPLVEDDDPRCAQPTEPAPEPPCIDVPNGEEARAGTPSCASGFAAPLFLVLVPLLRRRRGQGALGIRIVTALGLAACELPDAPPENLCGEFQTGGCQAASTIGGERFQISVYSPAPPADWFSTSEPRDLYLPSCVAPSFDAHAAFFEAVLELPSDTQWQYHWGRDDPFDPLGPGAIRSDYPLDQRAVVGTYLDAAGSPPWFWREGMADLLASSFISRVPEPRFTGDGFLWGPLVDNRPISPVPMNKLEGRASFMRFMVDRFGLERAIQYHRTARPFLDDAAEPGIPPYINEDFAAVFGLSLQEAIEDWQGSVGDFDRDHRDLIPYSCSQLVSLASTARELRVDDVIACGGVNLSSPLPASYGLASRSRDFVIELAQRSRVVVRASALRGMHVDIRNCWSAPVEGDVAAEQATAGDMRFEAIAGPGRYVIQLGQDEAPSEREPLLDDDTRFRLDVDVLPLVDPLGHQ